MATLTQHERNKIYDLLKQVTAVIEEAQRRIPDAELFYDDWARLGEVINDVDMLYCNISDVD